MGIVKYLSPYVGLLKRNNMKYIKVTNQSSNVNRLKLEKLGLSTKRDDAKTIGQFGSGIKFAPIAAVRKGMQFIFVGQDDKGQYTLEYIVKDDEDIPSVYYKYDDYEKPSSFTPDAGVLSWDSDFQIYREVVANAVDEACSSQTHWNCEIVDVEKITPVDGEFSVYITATDGIVDIHNNFDKYFSFNRECIYEDSGSKFKLYEPIDNCLRVYSKGVLVFSTDSILKSYSGDTKMGFFDYDFYDSLDLNEDRTVSNTSQMSGRIIDALSKIDDVDVLSRLFSLFKDQNEYNLESYYEYNNIPTYYWSSYGYRINRAIVDFWNTNYPNTIVSHKDFLSLNLKESIRARGYQSFAIGHDGLLQFLTNIGLPDYSNIFGEYFQYETSMDLTNYPVLAKALEIVHEILPDTSAISDKVGVYFSNDTDNEILGMTTNIAFENETSPSTKIFINNHHAEESSLKSLIATIVHEWDHYSTGISDGDNEGRMFRELADHKIGHLIYELWKTKNGLKTKN